MKNTKLVSGDALESVLKVLEEDKEYFEDELKKVNAKIEMIKELLDDDEPKIDE